MSRSVTLAVNKNGIATLCFNLKNEKINKLSSNVLNELNNQLDKVEKLTDTKYLIINSTKNGIFIAGADINEIKDMTDFKNTYSLVSKGQIILNRIVNSHLTTIALINGICLGGGLELALCCDYRIVTDNPRVSLGSPEVNLGIIPGFGATQRLPRLIGLAPALNMILSGKPVNAKKSVKLGLADKMIYEAFLDKEIEDFLKTTSKRKNYMLNKRKKRRYNEVIKNKLLGLKFIIYYFAKKNLMKKTKGQYPAPLAALKVIKKTYLQKSLKTGLRIEMRYFAKLATSTICKNLISLFFLSEEIKKDTGTNSKVSPKEIKKAAVLGAGVMGGGIAWLFSKIDIPARIKDLSWDFIKPAFRQIDKIYKQLKKIKKYTDNQILLKKNLISATTDYSGFKNRDIVIEAIIENIATKQNAFAELENHVNKDTIIASNTAALPFSELSKKMRYKTRFAGMHFFNPVNSMPLVEVIKGEKTSEKTVATIVSLAKKAGKTPIVVKDVPGFAINRILMSYLNEAALIFQETNNFEKIYNIIENFGMPMGPFYLVDTIGIDISAKVAQTLHQAYGTRMQPAKIMQQIAYEKKWLGKKSKAGFYKYKTGNKKINKAMLKKIKILKKQERIKTIKISSTEILERCIFSMINEAAFCLQEEVIQRADYLDMAMIMGTGFPAFRGGLLKYADHYGIKEIVIKLEMFTHKYGERFKPAELLIDMSINKDIFY
jgi:3-hydroxyacyl-CoA dehydrogenase/enoyl-CoA hydratase/3-hydroxybutyryl-CoA epimerase